VKRIRGGAPLRRIFSRRVRFTGGPKGKKIAVLKLVCGHVVERPVRGCPKVSAPCWVCSLIENKRIDEIESKRDPNAPPYVLDLKLDGLPDGQQSSGRNRFAIAKERKAWHRVVWFACRLKLPPYPLPLVHAVYTRHSAATIDPTNLGWSFKAIEDGLVECGVLRDDGPENYVGGKPDCRWEKAPPKGGFVTITITEERENHGEEEDLEEGPGDHDHRPGDTEERVAE
jgi:hypothetical protein